MLLNVQQSGPGVNAEQWELLRGVLDAIVRSGVEAEPAGIFIYTSTVPLLKISCVNEGTDTLAILAG